MKSTTGKVLVFDSGVGGLTIVRHIRERLPDIAITYLADNRYFPYGLLDDQALVERVLALLQEAVHYCSPDIIVLACNSASTIALPALRENLNTTIVGVVPAIKPAAQVSKTRGIGLLATPGTIQREYTNELIASFAADCEVTRVGATELVQLAELHFRGQRPMPSVLSGIIEPLRGTPGGRPIDTVVLACTHFPLLRGELQSVLPSVRHWVDSGEAIARRVEHLLKTTNSTADTHLDLALVTDPATLDTFTRQGFSEYGFSALESFPP